MVTTFSIADIKSLPSPDILKMPSYQDIKAQNIDIMQQITDGTYLALEDDDVLLIAEAFAYRELHLRAMVNSKVKGMMSHYAEGDDLDNFAWSFYGGITRLQGAYPYTDFKFTNDDAQAVVIPDGTIVSNSKGEKGRLVRSVTLNSSTTSVIERVELLELVEHSEVELDRVDDFFNVKVEQIGLFEHGATKESDERFLERSILSLNRPSTAGAINSYYYHILNSDVRVDTAYCYSPSAGVVRIILDNFDAKIDDYVVSEIIELLNNDKIKPLTDKVEVFKAEQIELTLEVEAKLYDLMKQREVNELIHANFTEQFKIAESLTHSDLIQRLHVLGVYSVRCLNVTEDLVVDKLSRIIIKGVNCVFTSR